MSDHSLQRSLSFFGLLALSLIVAFIGFLPMALNQFWPSAYTTRTLRPYLWPWISSLLPDDGARIEFALYAAIIWIGLALTGWIIYRRKGLWLLLGAPMALVWPYFIAGLGWACVLGYGCL